MRLTSMTRAQFAGQACGKSRAQKTDYSLRVRFCGPCFKEKCVCLTVYWASLIWEFQCQKGIYNIAVLPHRPRRCAGSGAQILAE